MRICWPKIRTAHGLALGALLAIAPSVAAADQPSPGSSSVTIVCSSKPGERQHCPADTSKGVALARSQGEAAVPARQDLGLRRQGRLGLGRLQRRVRRRPRACRRRWRRWGGQGEGEAAKPLQYVPNAGFRLYEGEKGQIYMRLFSYVALPEPEGAGPDLHRLLRQHQDGAAARGRPAQQVLPALLRLVPDPEVPLLPLRLVLEPVAGRSRAGGGRRQPELHVQPPRDPRRRDHQPSQRAQHRGPVPLLARRRRPADRGRVLPRLLHHRLLAQGRAHHEVQVHGDARATT